MLSAGKEYELAIATSTFFGIYGNVPNAEYRYGLFLQMADSLRELDLADQQVCWVIHDDASEGTIELPPMPFDTHILRRAKNIGQPKNYISTVEHACQLAPWVIVVDDDARVAPDMIRRALALRDRYPDYVMFGLYNSPYHKTEYELGDMVLKHSTCELGRFFKSSFGGWGFVEHPIPVLRPSAIQHCGKFGLNGTADDYDRECAISAGRG